MYSNFVRWSDGRVGNSDIFCEESPGSTGRECWVTPSESNLRESAAENIPPSLICENQAVVRVKRCGKSAPRGW